MKVSDQRERKFYSERNLEVGACTAHGQDSDEPFEFLTYPCEYLVSGLTNRARFEPQIVRDIHRPFVFNSRLPERLPGSVFIVVPNRA